MNEHYNMHFGKIVLFNMHLFQPPILILLQSFMKRLSPCVVSYDYWLWSQIGQALSIRPDILPVAYIEELQTLQDRVPPFSNIEAKNLIVEGLGKPVEELFTDFSSEAIAAASLGQVRLSL